MANKVGVNEPCPCGSGKKYKKCCLIRVEQKIHKSIPSPETLHKLREFAKETQRQILRDQFGSPNSFKLPMGDDHVIRSVWNAIYLRPKTETFHDFIINVLKWTVGKTWYEEQLHLPSDERHVIMRWCNAHADLTQSLYPAGYEPGEIRRAPLTGEVKELLVLSDDIYRLQLVRKLPRKLVGRLRSYDAFQGARYEIAIAATFVRCGFEIEWIEDKSTKHCEFNARQKATGEVIAVETKSRHRPGMLNRKGDVPNPESLRADVQSLFNQALEQNPDDKPFAIFIDVNLPHETNVEWYQKKWVADIREMLAKYPAPTPKEPSPYTLLVVTNFAWHYEGQNTAYGTEGIYIINNPVKYPLKDDRTFQALVNALDSYGKVSNDE